MHIDKIDIESHGNNYSATEESIFIDMFYVRSTIHPDRFPSFFCLLEDGSLMEERSMHERPEMRGSAGRVLGTPY